MEPDLNHKPGKKRPQPAAPRASGRRTTGRVRRFIVISGVAFIILAVLGGGILSFWLQTGRLQERLRQLLEKEAARNLSAELSIGRLSGNLFSRVLLEDVRLSRQGRVIVRAGRIKAEYLLLPVIFKGPLVVRFLRLEGLEGNLVQEEDGAWNITRIIPPGKEDATDPPAGLPWIWAEQLEIADAALHVTRQGEARQVVRHFQGIRLKAAVKTGRKIDLHVKDLRFTLMEPSPCPVRMDGTLRFSPLDDRLEMEVLRLETPQSRCRVAGEVRVSGSVPAGELALTLEPLSLEEAGAFFPAMALDSEALKGRKIQGNIRVSGDLRRFNHQLALTLDPLAVKAGGEVAFHRDGIWDLETRGEVRHLVPSEIPFFDGSGIPADLNTRFQIKGTRVNAAGRHLEALLHLDPSRAYGHDITGGRLSLMLEEGCVTLTSGEIASSLADLALQGKLTGLLEKDRPRQLSLHGAVRGLDPGAFSPLAGGLQEVEGAVNLDLDLKATLPHAPSPPSEPEQNFLSLAEADLEIALRPSRINGASIRRGLLRGAWRGKIFTVNALEVLSASLELTASGRMEPYKRALALEAAVQAEDLAALGKELAGFHPDWDARLAAPDVLAGAVALRGRITGWWDAPDIAFTIEGNHLRHASFGAQTVRIEGAAGGKWPDLEVRLQAEASRVSREETVLSSLRFQSELDPRRLIFDLDLADPHGRTLQAAGVLRGWRERQKKIRLTRVKAGLGDSGPGPLDRFENQGAIEMVLMPDQLNVRSCKLSSGEAFLQVKGVIPFDGRRPQDLVLSAANLDLRQVVPVLGLKGDPLQGRAGGRILLTGTRDEPVVEVSLTVEEGSGYDFAFSRTDAAIRYASGGCDFQARVLRRDREVFKLEGSTRLTLSIFPFRFEPAPGGLRVAFHSDGLAISDLPFPQPETVRLDGRIFLSGRAEGNPASPMVTAQVKIAEGSLSVTAPDLSYETVSADLAFEPGRLLLRKIELQGDREGRLVLTGEVDLEGLTPGALRLDLSGREVLVPYQQAVDAWVDTDLRLSGRWDAPRLAGTVNVLKGRANLDRFFDRGPAEIQVVREQKGNHDEMVLDHPAKTGETPPVIETLTADVAVRVKRDFWLKGKNLDSEIAGSVRVRKAPRQSATLLGDLHTVRGTYRFQGRLFTISHGKISFRGLREPDPVVDIRAATKIRPVKILVRISGTARQMRLSLDGEPSMAQADIISYLVFGRPVNAVKSRQAFDAERMAMSTAGQMTAAQLNQLFGDIFKLDSINIDTGNGKISEGSVAVGKYIAPDIFVTYRQGFELQDPKQEVVVTYELNPNVSVQAQLGSERNNGLDLFFRFDF